RVTGAQPPSPTPASDVSHATFSAPPSTAARLALVRPRTPPQSAPPRVDERDLACGDGPVSGHTLLVHTPLRPVTHWLLMKIIPITTVGRHPLRAERSGPHLQQCFRRGEHHREDCLR